MNRKRLESLLIQARVIRATMPTNYTYNKVREVLDDLEKVDEGLLKEALSRLSAYNIISPLDAVIFLKHHLAGKHKVSVDRVTMTEEGEELAVLAYPEGGLAIAVSKLPKGLRPGLKLQYNPESSSYKKV